MYVFDMNSLIDLWSRRYPRDVFKSLWGRIEIIAGAGTIVTPHEVLTEASRKEVTVRWRIAIGA